MADLHVDVELLKGEL